MKAKPIGRLWMAPAGWLDDLPGAASQAPEALPECHLTHGMNTCTLLDDAMRGIAGAAAEGWDEAGRRQRLVGIHGPGGEGRRLFGAGEGPTEAVAEAKQNASARLTADGGGARTQMVGSVVPGGVKMDYMSLPAAPKSAPSLYG